MTTLRIVPNPSTVCPEPDLLDDLDAFERGPSIRIDFPTEAERRAYFEGWKDHATVSDLAQKQREAVSLDMKRKDVPRCECGAVLVCFEEVRKRDEELAKLKEGL